MTRMSVFALATALALGSLTFTTQASARGGHWGGGHWGGGHWGGGHWAGGHWGHWGHGWGPWRGRYWGYGYGYGYYAYAGCWRWRHVWTPVGWVTRRVNVCYYPYY
jgi:hypothetical protein